MKKALWKGNQAVVEGAFDAGLDAYFGYPITPQNEIIELMSERMRKRHRVFVQAESELGAINMVFGAAVLGKRAMTSSSSPGISLMQETISYLVGCELPAVIVNVQRGGPGLGNISGAQSDYFQATRGGGHGDYKMPVLTPCTVQETYEMTMKAFDLAFKYRTPVMILTDGVIGQMVEPVMYERPGTIDEIIERIRIKRFQKKVDLGWTLGDAVGRPSRFIRSLMMENETQLEQHNYHLAEKFRAMESEVQWDEEGIDDARIVLVGYGTSGRIMMDAYREARKRGLPVGYLRLKTVVPFPSERIHDLASRVKFLVVEMSMGQMVDDVRLAVQGKTTVALYGTPGGALPSVHHIVRTIEEMNV